MQTTSVPPVLVAACGNILAGDDAFGPRVAQRIRSISPAEIEIVDLGMRPAALLDYLADRQTLIVVDAAEPDSRYEPGTLIDLDFMSPDRPRLLHDAALSSHGLSIAHELALAQKLSMLPPRVHLIAAAVRVTQMGEPMSAETTRLLDPAARRVIELARIWRVPQGMCSKI